MLRRTAIIFLLASICLAQDNVARMEQVVRSYVDAKQFMGSVLIARDGKVLLSKGYGSANLEWDIPQANCGTRQTAIGRGVSPNPLPLAGKESEYRECLARQ